MRCQRYGNDDSLRLHLIEQFVVVVKRARERSRVPPASFEMQAIRIAGCDRFIPHAAQNETFLR